MGVHEPITTFVQIELPTRIAHNTGAVVAGRIPVYTGSGLLTTDETVASLLAGEDAVIGPGATVIDKSLVRFDGTTGELIQGYASLAPTIGDDGVLRYAALTMEFGPGAGAIAVLKTVLANEDIRLDPGRHLYLGDVDADDVTIGRAGFPVVIVGDVTVDQIDERTTDAGVTIEGVLHKDGLIPAKFRTHAVPYICGSAAFPVADGDDYPAAAVPFAATLKKIGHYCTGTSTPTVTWNLVKRAHNSDSGGTDVWTSNKVAAASADDVTTFNSASIAAEDKLIVEVRGTSGTPAGLVLYIEWEIN